MHYAVHGHTAAELIYERADADKPHMGLTTWAAAPEGKIVKRLRLPRQKRKLNLKSIVLFKIDCSCLTLISACWNWKRMRRSNIAIKIFSFSRSSAHLVV